MSESEIEKKILSIDEKYKGRNYVSFTIPDSKCDIYYRLYGKGPRKVIFIMGLATRGDVWDFQADFFEQSHSEHYQIVVYDNRGCGQSTETSGRYTTKMLAQDASYLLDHLKWNNKVNVVGISMGGMIAQELTFINPNRIATLTLIATHAGGSLARVPLSGFFPMIRVVTMKDTEAKLRLLMHVNYGPKTIENKEKHNRLLESGVKK